MKSFDVILVVLCLAAGGTVFCSNCLVSSDGELYSPPLKMPAVHKPETPQMNSASASEPALAPAAQPAAADAPATSPAAADLKPAAASTALSQMVDKLVSAHTSFGDKQALWKKIKDDGNLDEAITELKQRAASNPDDAEIPATLGQAELQKAGVISQNGGSINEMGMLGMQADQNFDAALKLDSANWEAQFFKAAAMSYWPLELNKGEEVVQRLSSLIDQQEAMAAQPEFAQAYVVLGAQYQKMGQLDKAQAAWQLGAQKFPGDQTLQAKLNGQ